MANNNSKLSTPNSQQVLITGAAGFIGFNLCKRLFERGDEVIGLDNLNNYNDALTFAENDLKTNWEYYKQRFLEGENG